MDHFLRRKFAPGTEMARKLLGTGNAHLAEGNNWGDTFWGTVNGEGQNVLGVLLMRIRDELAGATLPSPSGNAVELKPFPTAPVPGDPSPGSRRPDSNA